MIGTSRRCCGSIKYWNSVLANSNSNFGQIFSGFDLPKRNYAGDPKKPDPAACVKETPQIKGREVASWPKSDPPPPQWRADCPQDPQPPNYDPYRIRVPEVVVPPLPPSNAKWTGMLLTADQYGQDQQGYQQGYHQQQSQDQQGQEEDKDEGLLGIIKSWFGRGKKDKGSEESQMIGIPELQWSLPMLKCALTRGPCSGKPAPDPPPCPPPPRKRFPWIYVWAVGAFLAFVGLLYKYYLYREEYNRLNDAKPIWRPRPKLKRPYHAEDLPACVQYLIVGTGEAGWAAYKAIMEHDKTAKIFFVSKEDIYPYRRAELSKHMWYNSDPPDIKILNYVENLKRKTMYQAPCKNFMDPVKFYRRKEGPAISAALGWCVMRVDADDHVVWINTPCGEVPIYYERCLLALGSKPRTLMVFKTAPKFVRDRVCTFRTIRDLEIGYRKVREAKHVTIIGGGFLGTELSWHMARMHKYWNPPPDDEEFVPVQIVHLMKDSGVLASVVPEYLSEWAMEKIKCENVTVMPKTQVYDAFESEDGRLQLTLSNGSSLVTDYVFVCIGNTPREEIAEPSYLELDRKNGGFLVNTELEARKHLYVAGDAASLYSQWKGTRIRMEHLINAEEQGYIAGSNMTGYWTPCNMEPHYYFRLGEVLDVEVVGEVGACMPTIGIFKPCEEDEDAIAFEMKRGEYGKPCYKQSNEYKNRYKRGMLFYLRDETVVGMVFWNFPAIDDRKEVATELLRAEPSYKDINLLAELLGYPELQCTYIPEEERPPPPLCITRYKWPKM